MVIPVPNYNDIIAIKMKMHAELYDETGSVKILELIFPDYQRTAVL